MLINTSKHPSRVHEGTGLQAEVTATYNQLKDLLGEPRRDGPENKVQAQWYITIVDDNPNSPLRPEEKKRGVTVYDWKEDKAPEAVTEWHIGAKTKLDAEYIKQMIEDLTAETEVLGYKEAKAYLEIADQLQILKEEGGLPQSAVDKLLETIRKEYEWRTGRDLGDA